jgi:hypothetical protein
MPYRIQLMDRVRLLHRMLPVKSIQPVEPVNKVVTFKSTYSGKSVLPVNSLHMVLLPLILLVILSLIAQPVSAGHVTSGITAPAEPAYSAPSAHEASADQASFAADPYLLKDPAFVTDVQQAIDLLYNLEFTAARQKLNSWKDARPEHPAWPFWEALELWWTILPDLENTATDELFIRRLEEADYRSDRLLRRDRRDVDALVIKALANGFLARLYSNRENWYKSLSHARVSLNVMFRIEQLEPDLHDLQFGLGNYNYFAAYLADEYPLVRPLAWMLPGGDRADGLRRLEIAADSSAFMIPESTYFLGHINLSYERRFDLALGYLTSLAERYPDNGYFRRLLVRAVVSTGDLSGAAALIDSTLGDPSFATDLPLQEEMNALRARIAFVQLQNDLALDKAGAAREYAARLARNPNSRRFGAMATYYAARTCMRMGLDEDARRYLNELNQRNSHSHYAGRARDLLRGR